MDIHLQKSRIEYIDLMKGFCIFLVVLHHSNYEFQYDAINVMLRNLRMPLYFALSGLFFKKYTCFIDFVVRKINKLVIPFLFFCLFPRCLCFKMEQLDSFIFWRDLFLVPDGYSIWFLRCLFITYIFYYIFDTYTKHCKEYAKWAILFALTIGCYYLNKRLHHYHNDTSNYLIRYALYQFQTMTSIMMLPIFHLCQSLRNKGGLSIELSKWKLLTGLFFFVLLWYIFRTDNVNLLWCSFGDNYFCFYLSAISGIAFLWCVSVALKKLPIFSYIGRYSLIVLGTHMPVLAILGSYVDHPLLRAILTILLSLPIIWLMKKYMPHLTAQKDILIYDGTHIKFQYK